MQKNGIADLLKAQPPLATNNKNEASASRVYYYKRPRLDDEDKRAISNMITEMRTQLTQLVTERTTRNLDCKASQTKLEMFEAAVDDRKQPSRFDFGRKEDLQQHQHNYSALYTPTQGNWSIADERSVVESIDQTRIYVHEKARNWSGF